MGGISFAYFTRRQADSTIAVTWRDLGVVIPSTSHTTASALAALASYSGGERFAADKLATSGMETSECSLAQLHSSRRLRRGVFKGFSRTLKQKAWFLDFRET